MRNVPISWLPLIDSKYFGNRANAKNVNVVNIKYWSPNNPFSKLRKKDVSSPEGITHFLKIVEFYGDIIRHQAPRSFIVEPKYGKGYMEPDIFMIWKRAPLFVEIQRSVYSHKVMSEKVDRYEAYRLSGEWKNESWQPQDRKVFPTVIVLTDTRYNIESPFVKFVQIQNLEQLVNMTKPKPAKSEGIQIKIS
jgi:hypothetical protein